MSLEDAFCIDFDSKMVSTRDPWEVFFSESLISWFLKDILNKTLTFEAEMDPKIDAKSNKKSFTLEIERKEAKMLQNESPKGSKKLFKIKKRYERGIKNGRRFFRPKGRPLHFEAQKVCKTHLHL